MTTRYITTDGEFNQLIPTYFNQDDVYIQSGVTCTMAHSPNFLIDDLYIDENSTLIIDGANGTAPIHLPYNSYIYNYAGNYLKSTEGWHIIGTSDGSPSQIIDLNNYFTGAGGPSDLPTDLWMLQAEYGHVFNYSNGTGREPVNGEWLTTVDNPFKRYGYVYDAGTSAGTGYIRTKYTVGTIAADEEICVFGWADHNGPSYESIWCGTTGAPEVASDVWMPMFNVRHAGTDSRHLFKPDKVQSFCFLQRGTTVELGDGEAGGTWGNIPQVGARVRAPGILISDCNITEYSAGTTANGHNATWGNAFNVSTFGNFELKGINFNKLKPNGENGNTFTMESCASNTITHQTHYSNNFSINNCVFSGYPANGFTAYSLVNLNQTGTIANSIFAQPHPYSTGPAVNMQNCYVPDGGTLHITDNIFAAPFATQTTYSITTANIKNASFDNNVFIGYLNPAGMESCEFIESKISAIDTGGTDTGNNDLWICSATKGSFLMKGLQYVDDYIPGDSIMYDSSCWTTEFKIRNLGSPHAQLRSSSYSAITFYVIGRNLGYVDVARCFFAQDPDTWAQLFMLSNSYENMSDYRDIITPYKNQTGAFFRGNQVSLKGCTWYPNRSNYAVYSNSTTQSQKGGQWNHVYRSETEGQILTLFNPPTALYNPYSVISGVGLTHVDQNNIEMIAGDIFEMEMDYFAKGFTGFTGTIAHFDGSTLWNGDDWSGTVRTYFQWDTGGTGFNGTWTTVADTAAWQGVTPVTGTGVKLKYRFECDSAASDMYGFATLATTTLAEQLDHNNWVTIDQTVTTITLENIVIGSRYYIYNNTDGELLTSGIAGASTISYDANNLPNGTQLLIRVRYSSGSPKYLPYETFATTSNLAANVYVAQIEDTIAS